MTVKMTRGAAAAESDVASLEEFAGTTLPVTFKAFLRQHNGAKPETNMFRVDERNDSGVNGFIPVEKMLEERRRIENVLPTVLPIAWAEGGNYVLIDLARNGAVDFWDHETGEVSVLASDFEAFIAMLRPFSVDDVQLKRGQVKNAWLDPNFLKNLHQE